MIWLRSVTGFLKIRKFFLESLKIFIQGNSITMIVTTKPNPPSKKMDFWTLKNVTIRKERALYGLGQNGGKCLFGKNEEAHSPRWMTKDTSSFYNNDELMKMNNLDELRLFDVFQVFHHFMKLLCNSATSHDFQMSYPSSLFWNGSSTYLYPFNLFAQGRNIATPTSHQHSWPTWQSVLLVQLPNWPILALSVHTRRQNYTGM